MKYINKDLEDLNWLIETVNLECKLAHGIDGKGAIPKDFWKTYSAMANTQGGTVLLGIEEDNGEFHVVGLENVEKIKQDLFNQLNNRQKVSVNLLTDHDVDVWIFQEKSVIAINIPKAARSQRPVYLNGQMLGNTWKRLHDGDRSCDDETVKKMLVEQVEKERDLRIFNRYTLEDVDLESLRIYRQMLSDERPEHPYLEKNNFEFLKAINGWRRDRDTGEEGLTLAGLLMFGRWTSIQQGVPNYSVDYRERPDADLKTRWVDRIFPDGTWSGNLFDFYRKVYRKLIADIKVPFEIKDGQRQEDTAAHIALREALINTIVHADYTGNVSIFIAKRPDMFGFRNPGRLRLPLEQVVQGGSSDCRNPVMHQMFLMVGLGERMGSGLPKIFSGWRSMHWRQPILHEKDDPEQTLLELHMIDLLPESVLEKLRARFGDKFTALSNSDRLILATAVIEGVVNHSRISELGDYHPHDLTLAFSKLEREGFLSSRGLSRAKIYHLPGETPISPEEVFPVSSQITSVEGRRGLEQDGSKGFEAQDSGHKDLSSGHKDLSSGRKGGRDQYGCLVNIKLNAPIIDSLSELDAALRAELEEIAKLPRENARLANPDDMQKAILGICAGRYIKLMVLAEIVSRNPDALRKKHIDPLVKAGKLQRAFPAQPNHEDQSYLTVEGV